MATWHHLNGQLFMPTSMLRDMVDPSWDMTTKDVTRSGHPSEEAFWNRKGDEAQAVGLHKSLRKEGMVNPVRLSRHGRGEMSVFNGFHRIAAAHDIDPSWMIPVTYTEEAHDPEAQSERLPAHVHREDETYLHERD